MADILRAAEAGVCVAQANVFLAIECAAEFRVTLPEGGRILH
jgi:hypothetical protein